jgi:hypothetical protein
MCVHSQSHKGTKKSNHRPCISNVATWKSTGKWNILLRQVWENIVGNDVTESHVTGNDVTESHVTGNAVIGSHVTRTDSHVSGNDRVRMPEFFPRFFPTIVVVQNVSLRTLPREQPPSESRDLRSLPVACRSCAMMHFVLLLYYSKKTAQENLWMRMSRTYFRLWFWSGPGDVNSGHACAMIRIPLAISLKSYLSCPSIVLPLDIQYTVYSVSIKWKLKTPK